jgi:DNA-binding IclR family transcriptional regulator
MEKSMSQIDRIMNFLGRADSRKGKGVTAARIVKFTGVPKSNVYKRIHDLREEGHRIYSNTKLVNGSRKMYYRLAA